MSRDPSDRSPLSSEELAALVAVARRPTRLRFSSTAAEVAEANRRWREIPIRFRRSDRVTDFAAAAHATIAAGVVVAAEVHDGGVLLVFRARHTGDPPGSPDTIKEAVVDVTNGQPRLVTFGDPSLDRTMA